MALESCVCGNALGEGKPCPVTRSPCRCDEPGPNRRSVLDTTHMGSLEHVSRRQYYERKRLGLPLLTPIERSHLRKMV